MTRNLPCIIYLPRKRHCITCVVCIFEITITHMKPFPHVRPNTSNNLVLVVYMCAFGGPLPPPTPFLQRDAPVTRSPTLVWLRCHRRRHIFQVPAVLELEAAMHQLLRQRASRLVQRRQDDIKDESSEFASLSSQSILKVFMIYSNRPR